MKMSLLIQRVVMHFGELGSRWGINRTVGQIYALIVVSKTALCASDSSSFGYFHVNNNQNHKEMISKSLLTFNGMT